MERGTIRNTFTILFIIVALFLGVICYAKEPFAIGEKKFIPKDKNDCITDTKVSMEGKTYAFDGLLDVRHGNYCHKAKHTLIGEVTLFEYVFNSDKNDPLQFIVDKDRGYVYVKGKGTITTPSGKKTILPLK